MVFWQDVGLVPVASLGPSSEKVHARATYISKASTSTTLGVRQPLTCIHGDKVCGTWDQHVATSGSHGGNIGVYWVKRMANIGGPWECHGGIMQAAWESHEGTMG